MRKLIFLIAIFTLVFLQSFAQISRGPEIGEIYFIGSTETYYGLYHSTDFGQTAICKDSVSPISSFTADKTPGGVYYFAYPNELYYSDNYGNSDSWEFKYSDLLLSSKILSGVEEGHIFSGSYMHSEDFGENFIIHEGNGFFGNWKRATIDNAQENIGYSYSSKSAVADSIYIFRSYDYFNNLELIHQLNYHWSELILFARGFIGGEVFVFNFTRNNLWVSYDYFENFEIVESFNFPDFSFAGLEGGNIAGEIFLLYGKTNNWPHSRNTYILHSTDYGITFDVYHPFASGNEPSIANFSTIDKEVLLLSEVEFDNFSIGSDLEYQWDFENNGTIDSFEEFPIHTYQDTGYYSVSLTVVGQDSSNTFIKENYIHVIDTITSVDQNEGFRLEVFPNPFSYNLTIKTINPLGNNQTIEIYNACGEIEKKVKLNDQVYIWDGCNSYGKKCKPGIYYLRIDNEVFKVILTN
ncbi:MAG: PKD domain-containing protein [Bacteroidales bacterium]|nr:PKD domain-containing protein [Bacteroidales bacterium]MCF8405066.1 PKD domain-containing protein [Bacteroidales bacterium]